jgi:hypothetical protein
MKADGELSWQYNGKAYWWEILEWCHDNFGFVGNRWMHRYETIFFIREDDYAMFLLRWA